MQLQMNKPYEEHTHYRNCSHPTPTAKFFDRKGWLTYLNME